MGSFGGHDLLHVAVLTSTILGAAGIAVAAVWPLVSDSPLPARGRNLALGGAALAALLVLVEWRVVH